VREEALVMWKDLETGRLRLRRLVASDSPAVYAYRSLPEVARLQFWDPRNEEEIRAFLEELSRVEPDTPGTWFQLGITLRESGLLIGDCGIRFPAEERWQVELGISLAPSHHGKGYATEALGTVLDYCFGPLGKHRVFASADPRNDASIALMERIGMRREAHFRESLWFKGAWADDLIYAILDSEWISRERG
jgi:RimJ/RimL family protein N-acetyltransferase